MKFYHSNLLNNFANITSVFTTRVSGNLAFHVNDDKKHVASNHELLAKELAYDKNSLIHMKQIHSDIVHVVDKNDNFYNPATCDALITNKANTPLMVMVADCSPILFYDDKQKVIAVAHAGRQGAFKNIVKNVIGSFINDFHSKAQNIHVSVGASIGSCCYEVGPEIYEQAKELALEYAMQKKDNSFYLDISIIIETQLLTCGVKKENIEFCNECTCCNSDKYYSYRADAKSGRFAGILAIK
ncbi:MAG: peptidoglycan editing factor PgeF [Sulfurimonas sp.]|uniref:peptidoglycan editing factor PgeF n=1 Tax=Sulfurimonas sp. TaxID=2022749 RepID=UPI0026322352|nr:peptidoglycan editing factor PgeF [Sulfurimonas sp.]MCW8896010.1 peptidoglycan editing factor PgeF [Sulfurimonas sp.]MCW8954161.1 peptidoglycan editing factor PgeF [Sulfurimonas sp.]MCW9066982.1 peptidoglycan editing factor PgeF [Sulfurimonas sp.]